MPFPEKRDTQEEITPAKDHYRSIAVMASEIY